MRNFCQEIIKSSRHEWKPDESPVLLHVERYTTLGHEQIKVSNYQMHPIELWQSNPILMNTENDDFLMTAVQALWKTSNTNNRTLRKELSDDMRNENFSVEDLRHILTWMVQYTPPEFMLDIFSVNKYLIYIHILYID